jgi:RHS repeat-associated protein
MGRTTRWETDAQGRSVSKQFSDGSLVRYFYEQNTSRLLQTLDEKQQITQYGYNRDNSLHSIAYANSPISTPSVIFNYDTNYARLTSMTDGIGTTAYSYNPVGVLGALQPTNVSGAWPNENTTYSYDELGRAVFSDVDGMATRVTYDPAGRKIAETNALGTFTLGYDGPSRRLASLAFPNGQTQERSYGDNLADHLLQRITHKVGSNQVSEFIYGHDTATRRIKTWSQQRGAAAPDVYSFGYDTANQLLSATVTNSGALITSFAYGYDLAANRLSEQIVGTNYISTYNALNQISTSSRSGVSRTNEWDARNRLVAVNSGNRRTEFTYDGHSRLATIRLLTNGVEASLRRFVWIGGKIREERDATGLITKRFFGRGVKIESGTNAGSFYYTRDHLGSVREVTDTSGTVRARYAYDPYGRRTKLSGDVEADFGFAGMFWSPEVELSLTHHRAYDPELGRWLSRDPLRSAELREGPNLYAYVRNEPINRRDPSGLGILSTQIGTGAVIMVAIEAEEQTGAVETGLEKAEELGEAGLEKAQEAAQAGADFAFGCAKTLADVFAPTMRPPTVPSFSNLVSEGPEPDLILDWDEYDFAGLYYELPELSWEDEFGAEILGDEAEILEENAEWAQEYYTAAVKNLAGQGLSPFDAMKAYVDILTRASQIRGSNLQ